MLMSVIGSAFAALISVNFGHDQATCLTQGPSFSPPQNDRITYRATMNKAGCRHVYRSTGSFVFEKAVAMKQPGHGTLEQTGEFSFSYKPNPGFLGKDTYVIYVCGRGAAGSGCSRITYEATIE